jgi:rhamnulokinase
MQKHYLAIDLGAESGRVILGTLSGTDKDPASQRLELEEIHRFPNIPVTIQGTLRWDLLNIFSEVKIGLRLAANRALPISGVSTDAWGVDYVLFREREPMVTHPFHYRDPRTDGALEKVFAKVPADDIFAETGIQFMSINTLFQLYIDKENRPEALASSDRFLNIGDYFNYLLAGTPKGEASLASTTQLYNPSKGDWAWDLIDRLSIPKKVFPALVSPGSKLGPLLTEVARETNLKDTQVVASCSHDTAAAVAAIPAQNEIQPGSAAGGDWAFISSGTWSLLGTEVKTPVINATSRKYNFTNEVGYAGTIMLRKNIVGLWIVQECKRAWAELGNNYDYDELTAMAEAAQPLASLIRPDDARFGKPGRMPGKIAEYCRETGQHVPTDPGSMVRCALESLALLYAQTLSECETVSGRRFKTMHLVGGGSRNRLLNQFSANALGIPVQTGPVEATAIGNILIQAKTLGDLKGDLRAVVRSSFPVQIFAPEDGSNWNSSRKLFDTLPISK